MNKRNIKVLLENGLHSRPIGRLVVLANDFSVESWIVFKNQKVEVKSILDVLSLQIGHGETIELLVKGSNAERFLELAQSFLEKGTT